MAIEFDIQVRNGTVKITVGGGQTNTTSGTRLGGNPPGGGGGHTGGGGPEGGSAGGCCGPVVIGPIVVDGSSLQSGMQDQNGKGGNPPGGGGGHTGGNSPSGHTGGNPPGGGGGHTGGGGPHSGSGSGCCCPVVIGPIVIGGCSSGQGVATWAGSQAVSINPPLQTESKAATQPFVMQTQQATNWCWAAVAVSVNDFFGSPVGVFAGPAWTQSSLANKQLGITSSPGCAQTPVPTPCNQPEALDVALNITKNLMPDGAKFNQHLTFESIQNWVTAQLPLGARITWYGGGAHFIALDGCKLMSSGERMVHVQDPSFSSTSPPGLWDYDALVESYLEEGYWSDTYLVMAQPPGLNQV
jgi:hypothetical protein